MLWFVVTLCFRERNPKHNPQNKQKGECVTSEVCTDVTGQHHSLVVFGESEEKIREFLVIPNNMRITRIEQARFINEFNQTQYSWEE